MNEGLSWEAMSVIIGAVITVGLALGGVLMRHGSLLATILERVDAMRDSFHGCRGEHADVHRHIFECLEKHGDKIADHEGRIRRIEDHLG